MKWTAPKTYEHTAALQWTPKDKYSLKTLFSDTNPFISTVRLEGLLFKLKIRKIRSTEDVYFHLESERMQPLKIAICLLLLNNGLYFSVDVHQPSCALFHTGLISSRDFLLFQAGCRDVNLYIISDEGLWRLPTIHACSEQALQLDAAGSLLGTQRCLLRLAKHTSNISKGKNSVNPRLEI